ncbi:hypothetical protein [Sphingomonas sanxanigenens]|uniref:Uncharacterized protein n=1 Tax=Sphingomonas sanxanigenens DSM 19645 = NX02 TaxID=1123269 RepID=W0AHF9_9SPHN|nr:hypothetical protein [Sphingomonas sanxanigenens]AHE55070.1 hypothetical protein NX02_16960 [Sphingomonas sanxanigenens DSM 19645 = NX02]
MSADVKLDELGLWPDEALAKLRGAWITTADQLIAMARTSGGVAALSEQTGVDAGEVSRLVGLTEAHRREQGGLGMAGPADTADYGMGALRPDTDE